MEVLRKQQKPRVLIVDDDPLYLRIWEKVFGGLPESCQYCLTNDPDMALTVLSAQPVDLVISDIVMGETSGYEVANAVYHSQPEAQIVLTTGFDCNLQSFDLTDPIFHVLYKPYRNICDIQQFMMTLLQKESVFDDAVEDSWSENEFYPKVTEWQL